MKTRLSPARLPGAFTLIELLVVIAIIAILASLLFPGIARAKDKAKSATCQSNLRQLALAMNMYDQDYAAYAIAWPPSDMLNLQPMPIWYRQLQPYAQKKTTEAGGGIFVCSGSVQKKDKRFVEFGGFWGWLTYAQNSHINSGRKDIGSKDVKDHANTILFADTDGWDAALYPDDKAGKTGNVCYRHSGGNDKSAEVDRGLKGKKGTKARANAAFTDGHVSALREAPLRLFTLAVD